MISAPPLAVSDHPVDRLGKLPLDLASLERLGREERGHQPELEHVVAHRGDHIDEPLPLGRGPTVLRHVEQQVRVVGVLEVLGEVDVADSHWELRRLVDR